MSGHFTLLLVLAFLTLALGCRPTKTEGGGVEPEPAPSETPAEPQDPKAPKPKEKPAPKLDPEVEKVREGLKGDSPEKRIEAAQKAGELGEKARSEAERLCELTLDEKVRVAALGALQKVHPKLFDPIRTIVLDGDFSKRLDAISSIAEMGREARPALPVVEWYFKRNKENLIIGSGSIFPLPDALKRSLSALAAIAPEEKRVVDTLVEIPNHDWPIKKPENPNDEQFLKGQAAQLKNEVLLTSVKALRTIGATVRPHQKQVVDHFLALIDGPARLEVVKGLADCLPEAARGSAKIDEIALTDGSEEVRKAADATKIEIDSYKNAVKAVGAADDAKLAQMALKKEENKWLRFAVREKLQSLNPALEDLAEAVRQDSTKTTADKCRVLRALPPLKDQPSELAVRMLVAFFESGIEPRIRTSHDGQKIQGREQLGNRDLYVTTIGAMSRVAPQSPIVRACLLAACSRTSKEFAYESITYDYWVGGDLLRLFGSEPEVQKALLSAAEKNVKSFEKQDYFDGNKLAPIASTLGEMAEKYPATRPSVLAALKDPVRKCGNQHGANVEPLLRAVAKCEAEAYAAYKDSYLADRPLAWANAMDAMLTGLEKAGHGTRAPEKRRAEPGEMVMVIQNEPRQSWWKQFKLVSVRGNAYRVKYLQGNYPDEWLSGSRVAPLDLPKEPFKLDTFVFVTIDRLAYRAQVKEFKDGKYRVKYTHGTDPDGKKEDLVDVKQVRINPELEK